MIPRLLIGLILVIGASMSPGTTASDVMRSPEELDGTAPVYLALGDSLAFGAGATNPRETGYVPLVHEALQESIPCQPGGESGCSELQLLNLAENGATTTTLLETQLPPALDVIESRNNDNDPGNDVVAITIDIGGNDAVHALTDVCTARVSLTCVESVQETLSIISDNLTATLMRLRAAAGPDTRITIMTYFNALIACDQRDAAENANLVLEGVPGLTAGLNGIIRQAAERANASVADTFGLLGPDDLIGDQDCLHANDAGYEKIAAAFASAFGIKTGVPAATKEGTARLISRWS